MKIYFLIIISSLVLFACSQSDKEETRPNIVYILADDLGYGDLGCYGQTKIETPNLDKMAAEGMLFTQHYSGSTVCAPSRSVLMTGMHTGHTAIRGNKAYEPEGQYPIDAEEITVAELLQQAGYTTGAFGKWGLGFVGTEGDPNNQGFDEFFGYNCQRIAHRYYPEYLWHNDQKIMLEGNDYNKTTTYAGNVIHEKALNFIEENKDQPFFLFYPNVIPHAELIMPEGEMMEKYRGRFEETPYVNKRPGSDYGDEDFQIKYYTSQEEPRTTFAAMVSLLDKQVGEVMDKLEELGLAENTIVMFASDNGPHLEGGADPEFFNSNDGLRGFKRDLYEGGVRSPMLAKWPGKIAPGTKTDHISAFWDILPTFADLAGFEAPEITDGISFLPTLMGKEQKKHDHLYWEFHEQGGKQAVRKGKWKLVKLNVFNPEKTKMELYNLEDDLAEENDVAALHPETVAELENIMEQEHVHNTVFPFE